MSDPTPAQEPPEPARPGEPRAEQRSAFGVDYRYIPTHDGGELFLTRYGWPLRDHLLPERWYDDHYYSAGGERLAGSTGTVYHVLPKPNASRIEPIELVVKFCRVGMDVPLMVTGDMTDRVDEEAIGAANFHGPFHEFGLVMELRRRTGMKVLTKRPFAIFSPGKRYDAWQLGRSRFRFNRAAKRLARDQADAPRPIALDIRRDYLVLFGWVHGVDAERAAADGWVPEDELSRLTHDSVDDLEAHGFRVLDHKPKHLIVRRRRGRDELVRRRDGRIAYALIDFELLEKYD